MVDEVLARRAEGGPQGQGQCPQAAAARGLKQGQLQHLLVQVHGDVRAELVREALQQLRWGQGAWGGPWWQNGRQPPASPFPSPRASAARGGSTQGTVREGGRLCLPPNHFRPPRAAPLSSSRPTTDVSEQSLQA